MTIKDILEFLDERGVNYRFSGKDDQSILGYSSIFHYREFTITWLRDTKTLDREGYTRAGMFTLVITGNDAAQLAQTKSQLWVENPKDTFFDVIDGFWKEENHTTVSPFAIIEEGAVIGHNTSIGAFTTISSKAVIGNNCKIGSNVSIVGRVVIGNDCVIQSGAVLGEDGFGFIKQGNVQKFVKHYGGVRLGDYVQIGSNTCVCRGAIDDTLIGEYTKIDNLCHIAHNVEIGERCLVIAGTVIMGSVHIGDDCWIATSMIRDLRSVGDDSTVGMGAVVVKDIAKGKTVVGNPAKEFVKGGQV